MNCVLQRPAEEQDDEDEGGAHRDRHPLPHPTRNPKRRHYPDRGCCGEAADRTASFPAEDDSCSQESNSGDDALNYPAPRVRIAVVRHQNGREGRAEGYQRVRTHSRRLVPEIAVQANGAAGNDRGTQPEDGVENGHLRPGGLAIQLDIQAAMAWPASW